MSPAQKKRESRSLTWKKTAFKMNQNGDDSVPCGTPLLVIILKNLMSDTADR